MRTRTYPWIALLATLLTFVVIVLGAYTRITDAGLSCPDWPGCYGQLTVPSGDTEVQQAAQMYPEKPVEAAKAWTEMVHRYCAGTVGLMILFLTLQAQRQRHQLGMKPLLICSLMLALLVMQVLLGMWTVTLKLLPIIVLLHLLMGMTLLGLLWTLVLITIPDICLQPSSAPKSYQPWVMVALVMIIIQIALGGWTSTNMAGPVCSGFPLCEGLTFSQLDFAHAFSWFTPLGSQTSLGLFTITSLHRLGALVVMCYVGGLSLWGLVQTSHRTLRVLFALLLLVLMLQMGLGFMNISPSRAHFIATLHHAMAAFLLLIAITVNVVIAGSRQESVS